MTRKKQLTWFIPEEFADAHLIMLSPVFRGFIHDFHSYGAGRHIRNAFFELKDYYVKIGFIREELDQASAFISARMASDSDWAERLNKLCIHNSKLAERLARRSLKTNLTQLASAQIIEFYQAMLPLQTKQHVIGMITAWTADAVTEQFSNKVRNIIINAANRAGEKINLVSVFSILTTPLNATFSEFEELDLLNLTQELKGKKQVRKTIEDAIDLNALDEQIKKIDKNIWRTIDSFYKKFCWLTFIYMGPAKTKAEYYAVWQSMLRQRINPQILKNKIHDGKLSVKKEQNQVLRRLHLTPAEQRIIKLAQQIVWLKAYRKDILSLIMYSYERMYKELGRRFGLSVKQIWMCFPKEINERFLSKKGASNILNERVNHSLLFYSNGRERFFAGKQVVNELARLKFEKIKIKGVDEIIGSCAYPGKIKGIVRIINQPADMGKMNDGDILVSQATTPAIVPAMKKAGAIVTNTGGLTCHAAIVARELKKPCVVGTKIATKVFKDGDLVEVDAEKGIVKKL